METWSLVNKVASYMLGFASAHSNAEVFPHTQACVFSGGRRREDMRKANKKHQQGYQEHHGMQKSGTHTQACVISEGRLRNDIRKANKKNER